MFQFWIAYPVVCEGKSAVVSPTFERIMGRAPMTFLRLGVRPRRRPALRGAQALSADARGRMARGR